MVSNDSGRVRGKVAVITGAGSGIGKATAQLLASEGAAVVVADIDGDSGEEVAASIRAAGGDALAVVTDVGIAEQVKALIDAAVDAYGGLDILHNNAAAMQYTRVDPAVADVDLDMWNHQVAVNLTGPLLACKHAIPHMVRRGGGSIIHTSSVEAIRSSDSRTGYGVTKAALLGLSRCIAVQYGQQKVRSNVIMPGPTFHAVQLERIGPELLRTFQEHLMAPATSEPIDQAAVVLFLASDESWFINGETIAVDGGLTTYLPFVPELRRRAATTA